MRFKRKKQSREDPFRREMLLFLRFFQEFFPTEERAILIAHIMHGRTVTVSAKQLWTEAFNAGLECAADFREACDLGAVFEIDAQSVKTILKA